MRLGIIGCGGISERHANGAAQSDEVAIVACCDAGEVEAVPTLPESVVTAFTLDALLQSAAERAVVPVEGPEAVAA